MAWPFFQQASQAVVDHVQMINPVYALEVSGYVAGGALAIFVAKTGVIWTLRQLGCSTPRLYYQLFPRLPWRPVVRTYMRFKGWQESVFKIGQVSSGGFASVLSTLTHSYRKGMVPLGLPWVWGGSLYSFLGIRVETHLQVIGSSGAGKSVWLKLLLSEWNNSAVIIDAKNGELSRDLASSDKRRQWVILRPYNPESTGQFNPFDILHDVFERFGENEVIRAAYKIAQSFIETPPHSKQPFFTDTSRGYLVGLILFVYSNFPESERNLGTVRDITIHGMRVYNEDGSLESSKEEAVELLHQLMMESEAFGGAIAGAAGPFINASKETLGNLQATLQQKLVVLDIPSVRYMLSATTRLLRELKSCDDFVLALVASVSSIRGELQDVTRLFTNMVLYSCEMEPNSKGQCLMALDEFNAQGYNAQIEAALPVARGLHKLVIVILIQDLEGLKAAYVKTYLAFTGNSTATLWFATAHLMNLAELSKTLGKKTIVIKDRQSGRKIYREVNAAEPDQLGRFLNVKSRNMIATRAGGRAWRLKLDPHFLALPVWRYTPDPDHKETLLRRIFRFLFGVKSEPIKLDKKYIGRDELINKENTEKIGGSLSERSEKKPLKLKDTRRAGDQIICEIADAFGYAYSEVHSELEEFYAGHIGAENILKHIGLEKNNPLYEAVRVFISQILSEEYKSTRLRNIPIYSLYERAEGNIDLKLNGADFNSLTAIGVRLLNTLPIETKNEVYKVALNALKKLEDISNSPSLPPEIDHDNFDVFPSSRSEDR